MGWKQPKKVAGIHLFPSSRIIKELVFAIWLIPTSSVLFYTILKGERINAKDLGRDGISIMASCGCIISHIQRLFSLYLTLICTFLCAIFKKLDSFPWRNTSAFQQFQIAHAMFDILIYLQPHQNLAEFLTAVLPVVITYFFCSFNHTSWEKLFPSIFNLLSLNCTEQSLLSFWNSKNISSLYFPCSFSFLLLSLS